MTIPRIGGPGVPLDLSTNAGFWSRAVSGGAGYPFNGFVLPSGGSYLLPPGVYNVICGPLSYVQIKEPVQGVWRTFSGAAFQGIVVSDGGNFRIANLAATVQSTTITAAGSGYSPSAPPAVTSSSGGSTYQAIVGGAVAAAITSGGAGYTTANPPTLVFSAPPTPGIQATGHVTVSAGAINTIVMDNPGAGYSSPPQLLVLNDPRVPPPTTAAVLTTSLTGAGTITGLIITDPGTGLGAAPTLTFGSGAATATAAVYTGTAGPDPEVVIPS